MPPISQAAQRTDRTVLKMRLLLAALLPTTAAMPKYFTFYGNDAVNQHSWSNVGTAGLPDIIGASHPTPAPGPRGASRC